MSKNTDAELLMRKFKDKIQAISKLQLKVGIPKEIETDSEAHNYTQELKQKSREQRELMADKFLGANIQAKKQKKTKETYVADIAFKNNFGSNAEKIPPRPFGSTMIPRYAEKIKKIINREMLAYLEGKESLETAYNRIGLMCAGFMKDNLKNGGWKANSKLTIFLKKSSHPLIDSGQMRQSITYVLEDKSKK